MVWHPWRLCMLFQEDSANKIVLVFSHLHPSSHALSLSTPQNFLPSNPLSVTPVAFLPLASPSSQGCGALRPPHQSAGPETRAPGCLHYTQQHRLFPEWTEPHSDPGAGRQLPAPGQVPVRHHHTGKRAGGGAAEHSTVWLMIFIY